MREEHFKVVKIWTTWPIVMTIECRQWRIQGRGWGDCSPLPFKIVPAKLSTGCVAARLYPPPVLMTKSFQSMKKYGPGVLSLGPIVYLIQLNRRCLTSSNDGHSSHLIYVKHPLQIISFCFWGIGSRSPLPGVLSIEPKQDFHQVGQAFPIMSTTQGLPVVYNVMYHLAILQEGAAERQFTTLLYTMAIYQVFALFLVI